LFIYTHTSLMGSVGRIMSILRSSYSRFIVALIVCFCANVSAHNNLSKDLEVVEKDIMRASVDIWILVGDVGTCLRNNIPSTETLLVDGSVDAFLRQYQPLAIAIKTIEEKNPINGAIVRDLSKAMTVAFKIHYELPVDLTGRLYDRADLYGQMTKLISKVLGFSALYGCGGIHNSYLLFLINNGGDVLSQGVLDAGKNWRKNQTDSFENYLLDNYSVQKPMVSIPAKGAVSYGMGYLIQNFNIADAAELATLLILNQATRKDSTITLPKELSFRVGFVTSFVTSVVKSLILTTTCKTAVDLTNYYLGDYLNSLKFPWSSWSEKEEL